VSFLCTRYSTIPGGIRKSLRKWSKAEESAVKSYSSSWVKKKPRRPRRPTEAAEDFLCSSAWCGDHPSFPTPFKKNDGILHHFIIKIFNFKLLKCLSNQIAPDHRFFWIVTKPIRLSTLCYSNIYYASSQCLGFKIWKSIFSVLIGATNIRLRDDIWNIPSELCVIVPVFFCTFKTSAVD
jgi:hypothetical protein